MVKISLVCLSNVGLRDCLPNVLRVILKWIFAKTWVSDWVSDWLSEIVTTREAIASNKIIFSLYFQHFQLLLWLKSLCYVYQMFVLRYWWPNVVRVILSCIFAKTWLSDWVTEWVKLWLLERLSPLIRIYSLYIFFFVE